MKPRVLAHRGASGLATENSLEAFRQARSLGADGVELDVHASADGVLVVHHDPVLRGGGVIGKLPLAEIRKMPLPNGEPVPTLAEALEVARGLEVWCELKNLPTELDRTLIALLDSEDPALVGVHSFDHRIVARLGAARPGLRRGILSASYPLDVAGPLLAARAGALWQEWHLIDAELVDEIHRREAEVIAWTVPDASAAQVLADLGVDALCGNYPDRLRTG